MYASAALVVKKRATASLIWSWCAALRRALVPQPRRLLFFDKNGVQVQYLVARWQTSTATYTDGTATSSTCMSTMFVPYRTGTVR